MGYLMNIVESKITIKKENFEAAFAAVKALQGQETCGFVGDLHFMWVDRERFAQTTTLKEALDEWRWMTVEEEDDGDITWVDFLGEKYGDEDLLFGALAPFVESGSYIAMVGEDEIIWRWLFKDGRVTKEFGRVVYDEQAEALARERVAGLDYGWPHFPDQRPPRLY